MLPGLHIVVTPFLEHCLVEIVLEEYHWIAKYHGQGDLGRHITHKNVTQKRKPYSLERDVFFV